MATDSKSGLVVSRLTHRQIAEQLGVSRQLVGFALRGEGRMSDELRRQILEVAQQNGYDRYSNREARSLAARRYGKRAATGVLAVIFQPTFEGEPLSAVPFFAPLFEGLETEAIRQGVDLALCALRPDQLPRLVRENQVDGIVCVGTELAEVQRIIDTGLPTVSAMETTGCHLNLLIDNEHGMSLAVRHLLELGHRRVAYLGSTFHLSQERQAIFQRELTQAQAFDETLLMVKECKLGINAGAELMQPFLESHGHFPAESGIKANLLPDTRPRLPFSALIAFNDLMAMGAIRALQAAGYRVPEDVSVIGFDDVSLAYNFAPSLTSIGFSRRDIGRRAIEFLCQHTQSNLPPLDGDAKPRHEVFPVELVCRASTCAYALSNQNVKTDSSP